jgi:hypothetical protein
LDIPVQLAEGHWRHRSNFIAVSFQFGHDPDELATKFTTQLVHKKNSETLCVVIPVGQIVFNLNSTPDEIVDRWAISMAGFPGVDTWFPGVDGFLEVDTCSMVSGR